MWRTVLRLEWRILRRDRAALGVASIFALFLIAAAWTGGNTASTLERSLARTASDEVARFDAHRAALVAADPEAPLVARDARDPVWMGSEGAARLAILPPSPLAPVAVGQRDLHAQAVRVTNDVHLTAERETETPMSGPTRMGTGAFDPAFLFVVLFPLVVIALSYELLSGERERGTLAMLLSQPVTQRALVLGKAGARALALCGVTLAFALLGLVVGGADLGAPGALLQALLYAIVLVAWAVFWFATAVAVSSLGSTSARNALLLVGVWLVLVVVIPGLVSVAVDTFYPPPSSVELMHEAREAAEEAGEELDDLQGRHDVNAKVGALAQRVAAISEELARRAEPVLEARRAQIRERHVLIERLRFASPAIVVQLALEDVAGSGATRHLRFEEQVDAFHARYRTYFGERIARGARLTAADLDSLPRMAFEEEPAGALLARTSTGILGLLAGAALLIALAWPGLRRVGRLTR